jgi:RND family efflux transporter MFP subunit
MGWLLALCCAAGALAQGVPQVAVVVAKAGAVQTGFELDAVVQPVKQSTVSTQASGRIASLLVKAGDHVRQGQLLATIDDREAQTGVQRSQAQLHQAQAELRNAQSSFERTRDLQAKGFVSAAALDQAESQYKAAKAGADQATSGVQLSTLAHGFTRVTAPYEGWVLQTLSDTGDLAVPGKPLLVLYASQPLRAVIQVPSSRSDVARAASGIEIQVTDARGQSRWIQPVSRQALPMADPVSQTVEWRLGLPDDTSSAMVPGQQLRVRFTGATSQRTVVPSSALLRRGELTAVYVAQGKSFVLRVIRAGVDHGSAGIEVLAGLAEGDQVALDPVKAGLAGAQPLTTAKP